VGLAAAEPAADVMRRMVENVGRAEQERARWIYSQKVRASLIRSNGDMSRTEKREYEATPGNGKTEKKLVSFEGEYRKNGRMYLAPSPGYKYKDTDIDGELIDNMIKDLVDDKDSRDGIPESLFPLRARDLAAYQFTLLGEGEQSGRRLYKIRFEPVKKRRCPEGDGDCGGKAWKGEAWVDAAEYQPVRIATDLAFKIPWAVKAFLGTNFQQMGFSISYERVAPNVWFPRTYGTEFRVSVLFGYKRTIALAAESSGFRRATAESRIDFDLVP
jgi:hypothetical protein